MILIILEGNPELWFVLLGNYLETQVIESRILGIKGKRLHALLCMVVRISESEAMTRHIISGITASGVCHAGTSCVSPFHRRVG